MPVVAEKEQEQEQEQEIEMERYVDMAYQRDGEERRSQVDALIGKIVTESGLTVVELNGSIDTRIREAINSVQGRVTPE